MSATVQRDTASQLAKTNPKKALDKARAIKEPWYRAQALSWVARYTDGDPVKIAAEAVKSAAACSDDYKKSAVRAWEVAALAERNYISKAKQSLDQAVKLAKTVQPFSSRSEALFGLLQAACSIDLKQAKMVLDALEASCPVDDHWRCKRAVRDGRKIVSGELEPRMFFW